jgi:hypothetical protein
MNGGDHSPSSAEEEACLSPRRRRSAQKVVNALTQGASASRAGLRWSQDKGDRTARSRQDRDLNLSPLDEIWCYGEGLEDRGSPRVYAERPRGLLPSVVEQYGIATDRKWPVSGHGSNPTWRRELSAPRQGRPRSSPHGRPCETSVTPSHQKDALRGRRIAATARESVLTHGVLDERSRRQ